MMIPNTRSWLTQQKCLSFGFDHKLRQSAVALEARMLLYLMYCESSVIKFNAAQQRSKSGEGRVHRSVIAFNVCWRVCLEKAMVQFSETCLDHLMPKANLLHRMFHPPLLSNKFRIMNFQHAISNGKHLLHSRKRKRRAETWSRHQSLLNAKNERKCNSMSMSKR